MCTFAAAGYGPLSQLHSFTARSTFFCWLAARVCELRGCAEELRLSLFPLSAFERIRLQVRWKRITHGMRELKIIFGSMYFTQELEAFLKLVAIPFRRRCRCNNLRQNFWSKRHLHD